MSPRDPNRLEEILADIRHQLEGTWPAPRAESDDQRTGRMRGYSRQQPPASVPRETVTQFDQDSTGHDTPERENGNDRLDIQPS